MDAQGLRSAAVRLASAYRVDFSTLARRLQELQPAALPPAYTRSVEHLYGGENISSARAADLLFGSAQEADPPPLPPRSEQEIRQYLA